MSGKRYRVYRRTYVGLCDLKFSIIRRRYDCKKEKNLRYISAAKNLIFSSCVKALRLFPYRTAPRTSIF